MSPTYRFQPIRTRRRLRGACPVCGRGAIRSRTFEHTVNPFNRNPDGSVRTPAEVRERVEAVADAWTPDFTHATCEDGAP